MTVIKTKRHYGGRVELPYTEEYRYSNQNRGAFGEARIRFFPFQIKINEEVCEKLRPFSYVQFTLKLNGQTRKRSKSRARKKYIILARN